MPRILCQHCGTSPNDHNKTYRRKVYVRTGLAFMPGMFLKWLLLSPGTDRISGQPALYQRDNIPTFICRLHRHGKQSNDSPRLSPRCALKPATCTPSLSQHLLHCQMPIIICTVVLFILSASRVCFLSWLELRNDT
jgi:hypothetical protein